MNIVMLVGRLTHDGDLRYTTTGTAVVNFSLAVDRKYKNAQGERVVDFINIQVWGKYGEVMADYLTKGKQVALQGELHVRSYEGQDGQKRWTSEVVVDQLKLLSPKNSSNGSGSPGNSLGDEVTFSDSDIPF